MKIEPKRVITGSMVLLGSTVLGTRGALLAFGSEPSGYTGSPRAFAASVADTYVLSDFKVQYPYRGPDGEGTPDSTYAGIDFTATWSGDNFPGRVTCTVVVKDGGGSAVGTQSFDATFTPSPAGYPGVLRVEVSGEPASAGGSCEPGAYPAGSGYTFDNGQVAGSGERAGWSTVTFTARWATAADPSVRSCQLRVSLEDGRTLTIPFSYAGPDGEHLSQDVDARPATIQAVSIACSELREPEAA